MNQNEEPGVFNLENCLKNVSHLLPSQGHIKEFIHHNTLHSFQDHPFEEAIMEAGQIFEAQSYMPLAYYREAYQNHQITDRALEEAISESGLGKFLTQAPIFSFLSNRKAIWDTLQIFNEKNDEKLLKAQCKKLGIDYQEISKMKETLFSLNSTFQADKKEKKVSIRQGAQQQLQVDWDAVINPTMIRLISAYLDQGMSLWDFSTGKNSFFEAIQKLVEDSKLPLASFISRSNCRFWFSLSPKEVIEAILHKIVGNSKDFEDYIFGTLKSHIGWSGIVHVLEDKPGSLLERRKIRLQDFLAVKLILELEFIRTTKVKWIPLSHYPVQKDDFNESERHSVNSILLLLIKLGLKPSDLLQLKNESKDQFLELISYFHFNSLAEIWHHAFEKTYYRDVLSALTLKMRDLRAKHNYSSQSPEFQAIFCLDDRECSFRRHLEAVNPNVETFSMAGFFGLDILFQSLSDSQPIKLCPASMNPKHLIKEKPVAGSEKKFASQRRKNILKSIQLQLGHHSTTSLILGWMASQTWGHLSSITLLLSVLHPSQLLKVLFLHKSAIPTELSLENEFIKSSIENVSIGFSDEEMIDRVYCVLRDMGLKEHFSPFIFIIGHGSSSINNPHFAAYDCGACAGKTGAANARVLALIANRPETRKGLAKKGIFIPEAVRFVGAYHDTCTDEVSFFDLDKFTDEQLVQIQKFQKFIHIASGRNAKERCRKFSLVDIKISEEAALNEVRKRSKALFEVRPELGHANNSLLIVGRRSLSRGLFLDRRAFLNSYNPEHDPSGEILEGILSSIIPVCAGINLEYYFSRVDNEVYGCGTKTSHNVCSLIGVMNGIDSDLRTGLPEQMVELHDPIRLLTIIEQSPRVILSIIEKNTAFREFVHQSWIKLACIDSQTQKIFVFNQRKEFEEFQLMPNQNLPTCSMDSKIMQSRVNIPVFQLT